jgi:hypothetical protein
MAGSCRRFTQDTAFKPMESRFKGINADLSAPVEMTKGRLVVVRGCGHEKQTADLSTPLRSGRDDKGEARCDPRQRSRESRPQISPLRCAPVEMTKGRLVVVRGCGQEKQTADPSTPLRSGRDDKGELWRFQRTTAAFHQLGRPTGPRLLRSSGGMETAAMTILVPGKDPLRLVQQGDFISLEVPPAAGT